MNKPLLGLILLLLSTGYSSAATDESTIKNQVQRAFEGLVSASKSLDENAYFSFFDAEKFVGLNSDGTIWRSIDDIRPLIASGFKYTQSVDSLEFPKVKLSVIDNNTVILVNEFEQTMTFQGGQSMTVAGGGTQVWSKHSGQWKLVSVSASNKPIQNTE